MTVMISATLAELLEMPCVVSTTLPTTSPPWRAASDAVVASVLACFSLSSF